MSMESIVEDAQKKLSYLESSRLCALAIVVILNMKYQQKTD